MQPNTSGTAVVERLQCESDEVPMHTQQASNPDPDGVPHSVVALAIVAAVAIATVLLVALASGRVVSAVALSSIAVPAGIVLLDARSQRGREDKGSVPSARLR